MKLENRFAIIIIVLLTSVVAFGQNKVETSKRVEQTNKQLKPVEEYVNAIQAYIAKRDGPDAVVTDVSDYNTSEKPVWKWYASREVFEKDERETYTTAFIWKKDGKLVQVNFTYSSPSGDWARYVSHTYYPNGFAAKVDRELRTFMGDIIVNRIRYYGRKGKLIKESKTFRDLATQQPVKEPESFMDMDADIYLKRKDLPFVQKGITDR